MVLNLLKFDNLSKIRLCSKVGEKRFFSKHKKISIDIWQIELNNGFGKYEDITDGRENVCNIILSSTEKFFP